MQKHKQLIFYTVFFLMCLAYSLTTRNYDFDLWARLIAGMGFVQTGHVIKTDFLSYTPTHQWIDHEWGSGVIFYLTQHYLGAAGLIILQTLLVFAIFFVITKIVKLKSDQPYNFLFYFFAFQAVIQNLNAPVRCHMFSFLLFAVFLYVLELARRGNNKPLILLPFITIFWNNVHGGVVSGVGLIAIYVLGEILNKKPFKKYIFAFIACFIALIINPYGIEYLKFLFMANTMERTYIIEWWNNFSSFYLFKHLAFKAFSLGAIIVAAKTYKKDYTKYLVLLTTLYLGIVHVKLLPFFVIAATCFLYDDFYKLVKDIKFPLWKDKIIYSFIIIFSLLTISFGSFKPLADFSAYPLKEIEFVKINGISGKLLINFGLGSYASYKLYPNNLIFMDGRYEEVYYDDMVPLLKKFYLVNEGWDEVLEKFPPDVMIIEKYYPVYHHLNDWSLVYEGDKFGVFVPKNSKRRGYKLPATDITYYRYNMFGTDIRYN